MISRGIQHVTFVDHFKNCVEFIKNQCNEFDIDDQTKVIKSDVFKFIRKYNEMVGDDQLDIVFAGPPYSMDSKQYNEIPELIFKHGLLNTNHGLLILEHDKSIEFTRNPQFILHKSFRSTHFSLFAHQNFFV